MENKDIEGKYYKFDFSHGNCNATAYHKAIELTKDKKAIITNAIEVRKINNSTEYKFEKKLEIWIECKERDTIKKKEFDDILREAKKELRSI